MKRWLSMLITVAVLVSCTQNSDKYLYSVNVRHLSS